MKKNSIKILNEFTKYLSFRHYSQKTIDGYCNDIKIFFQFIKSYYDWNVNLNDINVFLLKKIKEDGLIVFLTDLKFYRENSIITIERRVAALKNFFKWLYIKYKNLLDNNQNPTLFLKTWNMKIQKLPKHLELEDAKKIQTIFTYKNSRNPIRNNLIMSLFLSTGMRISELFSLNKQDVNFLTKSAKVIGKGNEERIIYFNINVLKQLENYFELRTDTSEALLVSKYNTRLSYRSIQKVCEKAYNLLQLYDYNYSTHTLRHTSATFLYKKTKDIMIVKEFLRT